MVDVVNLEKRRLEREPHAAGKARCLDCLHEWVAVHPLDMDDVWLECPACSFHEP